MVQYHEERVKEFLRIAEDEAARANFPAAIYRLSDAVAEAMSCISELKEKAGIA